VALALPKGNEKSAGKKHQRVKDWEKNVDLIQGKKGRLILVEERKGKDQYTWISRLGHPQKLWGLILKDSVLRYPEKKSGTLEQRDHWRSFRTRVKG